MKAIFDKSNTCSYTFFTQDDSTNRLIEWDEAKNNLNKKKHGISFESAAYVFNDPNRIEYYDRIHSIDEDRYIVIGKVGQILVVIFTERNRSIRLISARHATAKEKGIYYDNETHLS